MFVWRVGSSFRAKMLTILRAIHPSIISVSRIRPMSTVTKHKFIVWAPDYDDAEAYSRRLKVREQHLAGATLAAKDGALGKLLPILSPLHAI